MEVLRDILTRIKNSFRAIRGCSLFQAIMCAKDYLAVFVSIHAGKDHPFTYQQVWRHTTSLLRPFSPLGSPWTGVAFSDMPSSATFSSSSQTKGCLFT